MTSQRGPIATNAPWVLCACIALVFVILISNPYLREKTPSALNRLRKTYYINLEHRKDRKDHIETQLQKIGASNVERFNAIKHHQGRMGCALSHIALLERVMQTSTNQQDVTQGQVDAVLILEDDFEWKYDSTFCNTVIDKCLSLSDQWNVCLLSCNGSCKPISDHHQKVQDCQTTSAYIIKTSYVPTLLGHWKAQMPELKSAIDQSWKKLQHDKWIASNPIIGKQTQSYSDIQNGVVDYNV